jgi:PAS domain-containing protein
LDKLRGLLGGGPTEAPRAPPASSSEREQAILLLQDYEASGAGWFWSTDSEGRITYISDCVARQLGSSRSDLLGKTFHTLFVI